ncbi:MAG: ABC transporter permease [Actinobacteria bacterium]|nr:ABC transporter permease [Actinomycetota bacterium]
MLKALQELYEYRELLINLVVKELKIKYKNSILGFFWSLIHPLLMMLVFTFIFSYVFRANIENYPVYFLVGFLPWNFFVTVLSVSTGSIVGSGSLIKKVYFPHEIIPISLVVANLVNLFLSLAVLFVVLALYGYNFYVFLPVLLFAIIAHTLLTVGFSLMLAGLNVYFRDIEQLIGIMLLIWFYGTPVLYDMSMIPDRFLWLIKYANPMTSVIFLYREALYYLHWPSLKLLAYTTVSSLLVFWAGYWLFKRLSPAFAKEV